MRVAAALMLALLVLCSTSMATTYVVDPNGTGDYPTIQAAVNACVTGDVVELTDGTFTGPGNRDVTYFQKHITIRSQSGDPTRTTLDCEGQDRAFILGESAEGQFEGITMERGVALDWGGAVILMMDVRATFLDCIFRDNHAPGNAGAVMIMDCAIASFDGCTFVGNSSGAGGALCT